MEKTKKDYKKELTHAEEKIIDLSILLDTLEDKHKNLNLEFDKAVGINKQFQETIVEQRGIINYLESQVSKINKKITELENS
jgi:chromosome segregation ATPase